MSFLKTDKAPFRTQFAISLRLACAITAPLVLSSCTTTHIAGLDQIFFPNSTAKVGPLIESGEEYPTLEESPVSGSKPEADIPSNDSAETNTVAQVVVSQYKAPENIPADNVKPQPTRKRTQAKLEPTTSKTVVTEPSKQKQVDPPAIKAPAQKPAAVVSISEKAALSGKVILLDSDGKALPATGTLISLTPRNANTQKQQRKVKRHIIDMEQKEYLPRYSTINAGDQVIFVNKDKIQHNVFSSSGSNAFDLGTYGSGLKRAVTLEQPGIVKIYCNIHADMATFVSVGDQNLSAQADEQGNYEISNLVPGTYDVSIWNIRGEAKRTIELTANKNLELLDRIDTAAFKIESHKNKFGGKYSKNSKLFEDEFY